MPGIRGTPRHEAGYQGLPPCVEGNVGRGSQTQNQSPRSQSKSPKQAEPTLGENAALWITRTE